MVVGSQIIGVIFATFMIYLTFIRAKRKEFSGKEMALWTVIWLFVLYIAFLPKTLDFFAVEVLDFARTFDLLIMLALMFLTGCIFITYAAVKKNQKKLEDTIRKLALEKK
jgi:hypothetical protein